MSEITIIYKDMNESRFSNMLHGYGIFNMTTAIYEWILEDSEDPYEFPEIKNSLMRLLIHASICIDNSLFGANPMVGDIFFADPTYLKMLDVYKSVTGKKIITMRDASIIDRDEMIFLIETLKYDEAVTEEDIDDRLNLDMLYLLIDNANDIIHKETEHPKITRQ